VKQFHNSVFVSSAAACVLLAAQPVLAQLTQITDVKLNPIEGGISVILKTAAGDRPQVFTTKKDKSLVADVINAQLRLPKGDNFRQENPAPGIKIIEVKQLDTNSIRVIVTGVDDAPSNQPVMRKDNNLTLGFTTTTNSTASTATKPTEKVSAAPATTPESKPEPGKRPDVLVPNPQVTIDGKIAQSAGPNQPYNQAPPFLPRAVAPPVGDITQSNIDTSPTVIDLGTQERVPRLVLRDAPVREVLSLLARAANLNVAYVGSDDEKDQKASGGSGSGDDQETQINQKISLDIENEPVQDVFNYVLRLSGLQANRTGRTIFVGVKLPNSSRDIVMRNLRLNQAQVKEVASFLVRLGAESALNPQVQTTVVRSSELASNQEGGGGQAAGGQAGSQQSGTSTSTSSSEIKAERIVFKDSVPLLRGLQVLGDERTNTLTLIGTPKLVEMAMAQVVPLDLRRRQVVVNVKIIDVNLTGDQLYNTSFSFGVGNNYFSVDGGAASLNFGGSRPPTSVEARNSISESPVIANPYSGFQGFVDPSNPIAVPGTGVGQVVIDRGRITQNEAGVPASFPRPSTGVLSDPFQSVITNVTPGTPNVTTITDVPAVPPTFDQNGNVTNPGSPATVAVETSRGTAGTITTALPSLYQFPKRLLASLQAQVTSGNAKILTDPTLIVQEGQTADVQLTQQVVGNIKNETTRGDGTSIQTTTADKETVGLSLAVKVDRIDDNGFVSLSVSPKVRSPQAAANINVGTGSQTIFLVSERSLNSGTIRLRDGQTLILSGIIQDQDRTNVSKIPILGDIPLLGSLFRRTNRTNERREVIVLLTPQVMDDSERSSYGYNYTPSPQIRQILERRGLKVQPR
jgi:type IV pilus assembly protein PilQ